MFRPERRGRSFFLSLHGVNREEKGCVPISAVINNSNNTEPKYF